MAKLLSLKVEIGSGADFLEHSPVYGLLMNPDMFYYILFFLDTNDSPYVSTEFNSFGDANDAMAQRLVTLTHSGFILDVRKNVHKAKANT